ncbi:uncharacterized protein EDB91DRAFT_1086151 [Suillus paluster]|uniref:uncharacterized protein n=1 Tax=Suillus paluster TaxID=48578 RepID=UPI001B868FFC|nr:uncharacterized protein EDB91DRAFT_1086151 [Suillus paluster]KAG1728273.1 hypothetical protein EDB91DRAFT_1086151 [Suillus paluster]
MSPAESALPPLIDLTMEGIAPTTTTATVPDASAIDGLLFDYNQVAHPEDPDASGEIVDPGDPSNLVPEYNSSDDMDVEVEVKVEESSEEIYASFKFQDSSCDFRVSSRVPTPDTQVLTPEYQHLRFGTRYSVLGTRVSGVGCRYSDLYSSFEFRIEYRHPTPNTRHPSTNDTHESPSTEYRISGVGCRYSGVGTQLETRNSHKSEFRIPRLESPSTEYRISGVGCRVTNTQHLTPEYQVPTPEIWYLVLGDLCVSSVLGCRVSGVGCWYLIQNSYKSEFSRYYVCTSSSYLPKIYMAVCEDGKGRENTDEAGELNGMMYQDSKSRSRVSALSEHDSVLGCRVLVLNSKLETPI